jgi:DNA-binding beta-propeller fold protein YncE
VARALNKKEKLEAGMKFLSSVGIATLAMSAMLMTATAQTPPPTSGPAEDGSPAWRLKGSFPDPGGRTSVDAAGVVTILPAPPRGTSTTGAVAGNPASRGCRGTTTCQNRNGPPRGQMQRVLWEENLGYTYTYPIKLPNGAGGVTTGGVPAVALDSKGNLWVYQRKPAGSPQLFKFDPKGKLVMTVAESVTGHAEKAHGMAIDAQDNVYILDCTRATIKKISPDGKLLQVIGTDGHPGDWDEAKGQRLLWQPVMMAFAPNGDMVIAEGHGNESPNDVDSDDPTNNIGAARILVLDKDGKFKTQWFGHNVGPGKFQNAHGLAVDPKTGDVWIGDREDYRIVIYNSAGQFLRTIQTRNLVCAIQFDANGDPWFATGQDGQFVKLDRKTGNVIGAVGRGMGIGTGEFIEASYWVFDKQNNLYAGDTSVGRVTVMMAPKK